MSYAMAKPGPEGIKLISCLTALSMKFQLLIKIEIPKSKHFYYFKTLTCCISPANKC